MDFKNWLIGQLNENQLTKLEIDFVTDVQADETFPVRLDNFNELWGYILLRSGGQADPMVRRVARVLFSHWQLKRAGDFLSSNLQRITSITAGEVLDELKSRMTENEETTKA